MEVAWSFIAGAFCGASLAWALLRGAPPSPRRSPPRIALTLAPEPPGARPKQPPAPPPEASEPVVLPFPRPALRVHRPDD